MFMLVRNGVAILGYVNTVYSHCVQTFMYPGTKLYHKKLVKKIGSQLPKKLRELMRSLDFFLEDLSSG